MVLDIQCNHKLAKLWLFKGVCTKRGASLEWLDGWEQFTSRRGHWRHQHRSQTGRQNSHGFWWRKCTQAKAASKSRHSDRPSWGEALTHWPERKSWHRKLAVINHATDIGCSFHCQIINCCDLNEWWMIVRYNRFSPTGNQF